MGVWDVRTVSVLKHQRAEKVDDDSYRSGEDIVCLCDGRRNAGRCRRSLCHLSERGLRRLSLMPRECREIGLIRAVTLHQTDKVLQLFFGDNEDFAVITPKSLLEVCYDFFLGARR